MAFAIFRSPMNFFETTPAGRVLNRFSRCVAEQCSAVTPVCLFLMLIAIPVIFTVSMKCLRESHFA
jgi:hypothetical protein